MGVSWKILSLIFFISVLQWSFSEESEGGGEGIGFKAPLIHWSSPESPFYEPNANPVKRLQASIRASQARSNYFHRKISGSRKYPVSPFQFIDGSYIMKFSVGNPRLDTYAVADTGSDIIWIQCGPFCKCYKQRVPLFNPAKSYSYTPKICASNLCSRVLRTQYYHICKDSSQPCQYEVSYMDGAYSYGLIGTDDFTFVDSSKNSGSYTLRDTIFGCGYNNSGLPGLHPNDYEAPGVVGLGRIGGSLVSQLNLGQFSYCVAPGSGTKSSNSEIRFGKAANVWGQSTSIVYDKDGLYLFGAVDGIYVDNERVGGYPDWVFQFVQGGRGGLVIDTGTSFTMLYDSVVDNLVLKLKEKIDVKADARDDSYSDFSLCYGLESFTAAYIPDIELRFKDNKKAYLPFTQRNAWTYNGAEQMCLAIFKTKGVSVLGMYQQRDIKVGFNLKRNSVSFVVSVGCAA